MGEGGHSAFWKPVLGNRRAAHSPHTPSCFLTSQSMNHRQQPEEPRVRSKACRLQAKARVPLPKPCPALHLGDQVPGEPPGGTARTEDNDKPWEGQRTRGWSEPRLDSWALQSEINQRPNTEHNRVQHRERPGPTKRTQPQNRQISPEKVGVQTQDRGGPSSLEAEAAWTCPSGVNSSEDLEGRVGPGLL